MLDQQLLNVTGTIFRGHNSKATNACSYIPPTGPVQPIAHDDSSKPIGAEVTGYLPLLHLMVLIPHVQIHKHFYSETYTSPSICLLEHGTAGGSEGGVNGHGLRRDACPDRQHV